MDEDDLRAGSPPQQNYDRHSKELPTAPGLRQKEILSTAGSTTPAKSFVPGVTTLPLQPGEDTIVFLKPAHLGAFHPTDCAGNLISPSVMTVSSTRLMATGSPIFAQQFSLKHQRRLMNRHMLILPDGIKWVLDLSPPEDGDEIGPQMVLLSLTPGLKKWANVADSLGVPDTFVQGHDDACKCNLLSPVYAASPTMSSFQASNITLRAQYKNYETEWEEYSQTRHLGALVRLMRVAKGQELVIDSAPRLWTMVGLADILGCTELIQDEVLRWLAEDRNRAFVVYLPEEALVIGHKMKLPDVIRSAFVILVNELAMDLLAEKKDEHGVVMGSGNMSADEIPRFTVFGRKRNMDVLDDDLQSMVLEAARRWADKVREAVNNISGGRLKDWPDGPDIFSIFNARDWRLLKANKELLENIASTETQRASNANRLLKTIESIVEVAKIVWHQHLTVVLNTPVLRPRWTNLVQPYVALHGQVDRAEAMDLTDNSEKFSIGQKFLCAHTWDVFRGQSWAAGKTYGARLLQGYNQRTGHISVASHDLAQGIRSLAGEAIEVFDLNEFSRQMDSAVNTMCGGWLLVDNDLLRGLDIGNVMVLNLEEGVFKLLPIFADGNNDETGGVFEREIPDADMGPIGPGPAYRTGYTALSEATSYAPSEGTCTVTDETAASGTAEGTATANASRDAGKATTVADVGDLRVAPASMGSVTSDSSVGRLERRMEGVELASVDGGESAAGGPRTLSNRTGHTSHFGVRSITDKDDDVPTTMDVSDDGGESQAGSMAFSASASDAGDVPWERPDRAPSRTHPPQSVDGSIVDVGRDGKDMGDLDIGNGENAGDSDFDFDEGSEENFEFDEGENGEMTCSGAGGRVVSQAPETQENMHDTADVKMEDRGSGSEDDSWDLMESDIDGSKKAE